MRLSTGYRSSQWSSRPRPSCRCTQRREMQTVASPLAGARSRRPASLTSKIYIWHPDNECAEKAAFPLSTRPSRREEQASAQWVAPASLSVAARCSRETAIGSRARRFPERAGYADCHSGSRTRGWRHLAWELPPVTIRRQLPFSAFVLIYNAADLDRFLIGNTQGAGFSVGARVVHCPPREARCGPALTTRSASHRSITSTTRLLACPSQSGGCTAEGRSPARIASTCCGNWPGSSPTSRSVFVRRVRQGTPKAVGSSWIAPESVSTNRAFAIKPRNSR